MTKAFWRRWITAGISAVAALIILIYSLRRNAGSTMDGNMAAIAPFNYSFLWIDFSNDSVLSHCRNTVQGPQHITDEQGYTCPYNEAASNRGCCTRDSSSTRRFTCTKCKANRCCEDFASCVSCCLHPQHIMVLKRVVDRARFSQAKFLKDISDTFDFCLFKCRTSSVSVQHENTYRDVTHRYCYGLDAPSTE